MDSPPPSSSSSSSYASFPISAITILGILATAILLLSYYLFLTKCRLSAAAAPAAGGSAILLPAEPRGLDPYVIDILPVVKFAPPPAAPVRECAICLAELRGGDALRLLPGCPHAFHVDCIDTWLESSTLCPLCRTDIVAAGPFVDRPSSSMHREQSISYDGAAVGAAGDGVRPGEIELGTSGRLHGKCNKMEGSKGDECIDVVREKDESFYVQPMRRSLSVDSSNDTQLILAVRELLKEKPLVLVLEGGGERGEGSSSSGGGGGGGAGGRVRRPFFSFGSGRGSRSAVLPVDIAWIPSPR